MLSYSKDRRQNLKQRAALLRVARRSYLARRVLWEMCRRDILFWLNLFVWLSEPRPGGRKGDIRPIPFITYPFQDAVIPRIEEAIGRHSLGIQKSRDMGVTWMVVLTFEHRFEFFLNQSFLCVSRNEEYVNSSRNAKSLFWKIAFALKYQPDWLKGRIDKQKHGFYHLDTGSAIDGEATTGNIARGDRRTAILKDEFAAVEPPADAYRALAAVVDATDCVIYNSTHQGSGAFREVIEQRLPKEHVLTLHWSMHPEKNKGLEIRDGKPWSPWYEKKCLEIKTRWIIEQELDISPLGAQATFFPIAYLEECIARDVRLPYFEGRLDYSTLDLVPTEFVMSAGGPLKLWLPSAMPQQGRGYVLAMDVATGSGLSNSVISVGDCVTGEKVAEFASPKILSHEFAALSVAMGKWFNDAYLIWEANGPGAEVGKAIIAHGYRNLYWMKDETALGRKASDRPGWTSNGLNKRVLLSEYRAALGVKFINRSEPALKECKEYIYDSDSISHSLSISTNDRSGARANHGDRVIADALCYKGMKDRGLLVERKPEEVAPPINSLAWRMQLWDQAPKQKHWYARN